jgi:hypothetical protein
LLPQFSGQDYYCTLQIRIPAEYLTFNGNIAARARALWGTEVYADDSDIVAGMTLVSGFCELAPNFLVLLKSTFSLWTIQAFGYSRVKLGIIGSCFTR